MKKLMGFFLVFFMLAACQKSSRAFDDKANVKVNIFHTNDLMGYVTDCGCHNAPLGGLARRATVTRENIPNADFNLFIDAGGHSRGSGEMSQINNDYLLNGLSQIGYNVFNLSYRDFINGGNALKELGEKYHIQFISSNAFYTESGERFTEPFILETIQAENDSASLPYKQLTVGIIGLVDEQKLMFSKRLGEPVVECREPLTVAKDLVPQVRKKADLVILLYSGKYDKLKEILNNVRGIDVALMSGQYYMITPKEKYQAVLATTPSLGKYAGILKLELNAKKKIVANDMERIPLDTNIQDDPALTELITQFGIAEKKFQESELQVAQ